MWTWAEPVGRASAKVKVVVWYCSEYEDEVDVKVWPPTVTIAVSSSSSRVFTANDETDSLMSTSMSTTPAKVYFARSGVR